MFLLYQILLIEYWRFFGGAVMLHLVGQSSQLRWQRSHDGSHVNKRGFKFDANIFSIGLTIFLPKMFWLQDRSWFSKPFNISSVQNIRHPGRYSVCTVGIGSIRVFWEGFDNIFILYLRFFIFGKLKCLHSKLHRNEDVLALTEIWFTALHNNLITISLGNHFWPHFCCLREVRCV